MHGLVRTHLLEAIVPKGQAGQTLGGKFPEQTFADPAISDSVKYLFAWKNVGQVKQVERVQAHGTKC